MKKAYLIKYGEIAIKGKNRYIFENVLVSQVKERLHKLGEFKVSKEQGRIYVEPIDNIAEDTVIETISKIFGIIAIMPVIVLDDSDFENIKKSAVEFVNDQYENKKFTFKVEARRADKNYSRNSMEIAVDLGEHLLNTFNELKVDVKKPEVKIWVEIRNSTYIYSKVYKGLGGMPVGTNGKAMLMLSGGIDSPVAGWMIAKRGVAIDAIYYHSHPYTSDRAKDKVIDLAKIISRYTGNFKLNVINFTEIQMYIYEKCPHEQLTIIMRRIMMIIAEKIAIQSNALALITGESIGQVASQTIQSLVATNSVCEMPVFRPLIGFDKQDIVDISQRINTYETSILPYEDCCTVFVAKHPATKPSLKAVEKFEKRLVDIEAMIEKAIETVEIIEIKPE